MKRSMRSMPDLGFSRSPYLDHPIWDGPNHCEIKATSTKVMHLHLTKRENMCGMECRLSILKVDVDAWIATISDCNGTSLSVNFVSQIEALDTLTKWVDLHPSTVVNWWYDPTETSRSLPTYVPRVTSPRPQDEDVELSFSSIEWGDSLSISTSSESSNVMIYIKHSSM